MSEPGPPIIENDEEQGRPRRRGLGLLFWAFLLFGLICVLAGAAIATYGPRLFPAPPPPAPTATAAIATPAPAPLMAQPAPAAPDTALAASGVQLNGLAERLDRVEGDQQRLNRAAATALAASALSEAAARPGPFIAQLQAVAPVLASSADIRAIEPYARAGAPTTASLIQAWPEVASNAAIAARANAPGEGVLDRVARALAAVVTVRRVDRLDGPGVDAVLARASRDVAGSDLQGALTELRALPPTAAAASAAWQEAARRRVDIDRQVEAIRTAALSELTRLGAEPPTA